MGGERGQERDLYHWRGPDGRDVLVWHLPPNGYEIGAALPADADRLPAAWHRVRATLVELNWSALVNSTVFVSHVALRQSMTNISSVLKRSDNNLGPADVTRIIS